MMLDKNFLLQLDKERLRTTYAKITALTFDETPIEQIEGRVTQGSINLDGASSVRRTCSLTLVAQQFDYRNYLWGLNTKFKLEIGLKNNINSAYSDIIWFNQGIYLISSFNTSRSTNNFTISISGKDKMCQLNGEVGGVLTSSVDFGTMEEKMDNGDVRIVKIPVKDIIRNAVHMYAGEPIQNIIINDIDEYGLELLEYRYDTPMYLYRATNSNNFQNIIMESDSVDVYLENSEEPIKLKEVQTSHLEVLTNELHGIGEPLPVKFDNSSDSPEYILTKITFGQTAGYRKTELTYAGDLIGKVGETIVSILDKIKNMLGEFEYFYDTDGKFVFQRKRSFVNTLWSPTETDGAGEKYTESLMYSTPYAYKFIGGELVTAFNNNPDIANVRNDYSIWGERTSIESGGKIPIHMRYVIDKKPVSYTSITVNAEHPDLKVYNEKYGTQVSGQTGTSYSTTNYDWRELIYQMAKDHLKYAHILNDFENLIKEANPIDFPMGITGYEQYYTDIIGFWRDLYYPGIEHLTQMWENEYISDKEYDLWKDRVEDYYNSKEVHPYWNKNVYEHPERLNFWFDFLDVQGELSQYSVKNIGIRPKAINDTNVKSIYFRETPDVIFVEDQIEHGTTSSAYRVIQVPGIEQMFSISGQGKSAKNKLDELIYQHGYATESATITTVPIYHLEPNSRVYLYDEDTHLDGDYIISKITLPLAYNGTMSLTATKAAETWLF